MKKLLICVMSIAIFICMTSTIFAEETTTYTSEEATFGISVGNATIESPIIFQSTNLFEIPIIINNTSASSITISAGTYGDWTGLQFYNGTGNFTLSDEWLVDNPDIFRLFLHKDEKSNPKPAWIVNDFGDESMNCKYISINQVELVDSGEFVPAGEYIIELLSGLGRRENAPYGKEYSFQINWTATAAN